MNTACPAERGQRGYAPMEDTMKALELNTVNALVAFAQSDVSKLSDAEVNAAYDMVSKPFCGSLMDAVSYDTYPEWQSDLVQAVYWKASNEQDRRFKERNEDKVQAMFDRYFKGKTWEEIRSSEELYDLWGSYSDYHKDVYGYRPHAVVCGEYVKPW